MISGENMGDTLVGGMQTKKECNGPAHGIGVTTNMEKGRIAGEWILSQPFNADLNTRESIPIMRENGQRSQDIKGKGIMTKMEAKVWK